MNKPAKKKIEFRDSAIAVMARALEICDQMSVAYFEGNRHREAILSIAPSIWWKLKGRYTGDLQKTHKIPFEMHEIQCMEIVIKAYDPTTDPRTQDTGMAQIERLGILTNLQPKTIWR